MKLITFIMIAVTLMLTNTASWAMDCEKMQKFFSGNKDDYVIGIQIDKENKKFSIIYYTRLNEDHEFSELANAKSFKAVYPDGYPTMFKGPPSKFYIGLQIFGSDKIDNAKMLAFEGFADSFYPIAVDCVGLQKEKPWDRAPVRCTGRSQDIPDKYDGYLGSPTELVEKLMKDAGGVVIPYNFVYFFAAADPCIYMMKIVSANDLFVRSSAADTNKDGIPDSFNTPPLTSKKFVGKMTYNLAAPAEETPEEETPEEETATEEPSQPQDETTPAAGEGCVGDKDCDGVTDAKDECPDVAGTLALVGCPPPTSETETLSAGAPQEVTKAPLSTFDKEDGCSLTSAACANPLSYLFIATALLAIVHRRTK